MTEESTEKVISPEFPNAESAAESSAETEAESQPFISAEDILSENDRLKELIEEYGGKKVISTLEKAVQESSLKPFQAELILLQKYLEKTKRRMIILFEGRDASGKGGTIRRVTRYMNEKHYRVVALGKPSDSQRTQWFFQRYVEQFPRGGEVVLFDRSWYNRAMVEPIFGFCTPEEYKVFMKGVVGFEKDLVRQGPLLWAAGRCTQSSSRPSACRMPQPTGSSSPPNPPPPPSQSSERRSPRRRSAQHRPVGNPP